MAGSIVQENPAAIPMDVALPGPLPKVRVPSVARDVGVSLGEFQRDDVRLLEAGLPAIAAIPTAGLPAERPAVPTEARLFLLPAKRVPTAPTETPIDLKIALTGDQTANYALASHDVQAPPPEVVAERFGLPPARTSAEAAQLDARPTLRLAARSDSHHRIELALPGAHLDFPTDVRHASQEPRAASPERAVASGKPQVSKTTPVSSARQRARPPAETPRVAAATAVKRVVSQRTVEDMLRDRILGN